MHLIVKEVVMLALVLRRHLVVTETRFCLLNTGTIVELDRGAVEPCRPRMWTENGMEVEREMGKVIRSINLR